RDRVVGERHWIVLGSEQELRLEGARRGGPRGEREGNGERKWHSNTRRGHRIVLLRPPPQFRQARWLRQGTTAKWRGHATAAAAFRKTAVHPQIRTIGLAIANPAGYGAARSRGA